MPVAFADAVIHSRKGDRRALVITPTEHRRLGLERLWELQRTADESEIESGIVDRVRAARQPHQIVIFRGRDDEGTASWGFDEALATGDAEELARLLVISHLPTHRALLAHGIYVMVHTDFGPREADLMRAASHRVLAERTDLELADESMRAVHEANLWILRYLNFYFSLGFERVVTSVLPDKLPLIETRIRKLEVLARALRDG